MRVLILGGFGAVGASVARDLIKSNTVSQLMLAGRNVHLDKVHSSVQKSDKVSTTAIDMTNSEALVSLIKKHDIIVNCAGPFYRHGIRTIKAAIKAGTRYIDICDDYDVIQEAFTLDKEAQEAGVLICVGSGGGPGLTNLLAKYAADKLDEVEEIRVYWIVGVGDPSGAAAFAHGFHVLQGEVPQYINGKWVKVPAFSAAEEVPFLEPIGNCPVYYVGHPEPVMLPRYIKGVKTVTCKGGFAPAWANQMLVDLGKYGLMTTEPLKLNGVSISPLEYITKVMAELPSFLKLVEKYDESPANIMVKGKEAGREVSYRYRLTGKVTPGTAISTSIAAQMILEGEAKGKGVVGLEGALDTRAYFKRFAARHLRVDEEKMVTSEAQF